MTRKITWGIAAAIAVAHLIAAYVAIWAPELIDGERLGETALLSLLVIWGLWTWGLFDD